MDNEKLKRISTLFKKLNEEINQMEQGDKCSIVVHSGTGIHKQSSEIDIDNSFKFIRIDTYRRTTEIIDDSEN